MDTLPPTQLKRVTPPPQLYIHRAALGTAPHSACGTKQEAPSTELLPSDGTQLETLLHCAPQTTLSSNPAPLRQRLVKGPFGIWYNIVTCFMSSTVKSRPVTACMILIEFGFGLINNAMQRTERKSKQTRNPWANLFRMKSRGGGKFPFGFSWSDWIFSQPQSRLSLNKILYCFYRKLWLQITKPLNQPPYKCEAWQFLVLMLIADSQNLSSSVWFLMDKLCPKIHFIKERNLIFAP